MMKFHQSFGIKSKPQILQIQGILLRTFSAARWPRFHLSLPQNKFCIIHLLVNKSFNFQFKSNWNSQALTIPLDIHLPMLQSNKNVTNDIKNNQYNDP